MRFKYLIVIAVVLTLIASSIAGCSSKEQKLTKINFVETVHSIFYAPYYVAVSQGFFKEEGLELVITTAQGSDKAATAVLSGTADIGLQGPETTVYVLLEGRDDYLINFGQLTRKDGSFLLGKKPEPDFKWENLRGKKVIGGRPGSMPEMTLEYVLKQHGLDPKKDLTLITNLQFTAAAGAFMSSDADYVALFEPTASMVEKQGGGYIVASVGASSHEVPYTTFNAKKSYIEKHPDIIQKFVNAVYKGMLWVDCHSPKEVAEAIKPFFPDADVDLMATAIERYKNQNTWGTTLKMKAEDFDFLQTILLDSGVKKEKVDSRLLINNTFAEKAEKTIKK
ncbi:ABC transporter substrate-binding protein [Caldanaerobacter subterraneus KAk]|uniref:ABC transporter substrate-binding protein n=1 Tax=Caldanaerobacter subterraneus TaxID=911092 RepID=UPI0032C19E1C